MTFTGSSTTSGTIHLTVLAFPRTSRSSVTDQLPGSGSKVQILSANCEEIDGSFAPPLAQTATANGLVVQQLTAQFAAFRNADQLPPSVIQQIDALNQRALAFEPGAQGMSVPDFLQQVGMLLHSAKLLYTRIYDLIGDAGCDASGTWGTFLLPTVQVLFGSGLRPGASSAPIKSTHWSWLASNPDILQPEAVAAALPNLSQKQDDLNDPSQRLIFDLWWLHEDLSDQLQKATSATGGPDAAVLTEVYLTAQMLGFDDLMQEMGA